MFKLTNEIFLVSFKYLIFVIFHSSMSKQHLSVGYDLLKIRFRLVCAWQEKSTIYIDSLLSSLWGKTTYYMRRALLKLRPVTSEASFFVT